MSLSPDLKKGRSLMNRILIDYGKKGNLQINNLIDLSSFCDESVMILYPKRDLLIFYGLSYE